MLFALLLLALAFADERGFPLYFGSFEDVGESEVASSVISAKEADNKITQWTKGCPADVYIIINDNNPFDLTGLKWVKRTAENSLTRGSLLTRETVDLHELALDLESYCEAKLLDVDASKDALTQFEHYSDTQTRVFYIDIPEDLSHKQKDGFLHHVFGGLPSPYVSVIYTSHVLQSHPVLRSVVPSKKRLGFKDMRNDKEKIRPIIAPLFDKGNVGHTAPEPAIELPDNFFITLAVGSILFALFLAYRDYQTHYSPKTKAPVKPVEPITAEPASPAQTLPVINEPETTVRRVKAQK